MSGELSEAEAEMAQTLEQQAGMEHEAAVQVLRAHHWDLDAARAAVLASTSASPPPEQRQGWLSWGWGLARNAVSNAWWLASSAVGLFWGGRSQHQQSEAQRFVAEFSAQYGATYPPFFEGTFNEAVATARAANKLMLIYLHSALHADTPLFCRATLCAPSVVAFLAEHFVVWGGDIREPEGFALSNDIGAEIYPFVAVVFVGSSPPQPLAQVSGMRDASEFVAALTAIVEGPGAELLNAARAQQTRVREGRALREEQQLAFQQSLAADREKERRRAAEEAARAEAQRRRQQAKEARIAAVRKRASALSKEEPAATAAADSITTIAVRLPSGQRVIRRFYNNDTLEAVFAFVDSHLFQPSSATEAPQKYTLCTNFPRMGYTWEQAETIRVGTLGDQALMYVQLQEDEAEEGGRPSAEAAVGTDGVSAPAAPQP